MEIVREFKKLPLLLKLLMALNVLLVSGYFTF